MRKAEEVNESSHIQNPQLLSKTHILARYLKTLSSRDIEKYMGVSGPLSIKTRELLQGFTVNDSSAAFLPAIDIFLGDIYSGLQVQSFSKEDRRYANEHLFILSGLYGILRALDTIQPYRLEMGYKLPADPLTSQKKSTTLYSFWGDTIARSLPSDQPIINLSAKEYTKALFPHFKNIPELANLTIISPKFLTVSSKTGQPTFVTVHAKIARGAYARWIIQKRITDITQLKDFNDLGYRYDEDLSTDLEPTFVTKNFEGLGLSVRLS